MEQQSHDQDFADRLNELMSKTHQPNGQEWTNAALARAVCDFGVNTSPSNLSLLRSGQRTNPSANLLGALARVFDVPVDFFFSRTTEEWVGELEAVLALRRCGAHHMALRSAGKLTDSGIAKLAALADYIADLESGSGVADTPVNPTEIP